jgi:hypothetical protein
VTPELGIDPPALRGDTASSASPPDRPLATLGLLVEQVQAGADHIDFARDAKAALEALDAIIVVLLDHEWLTHTRKYIRKYI